MPRPSAWASRRTPPGQATSITSRAGKTEPFAPDSTQPLIVGSPRTVLEKVQEMLRITSANYLLCVFSFGDLAPEHAKRSLELFSAEVQPKLKG